MNKTPNFDRFLAEYKRRAKSDDDRRLIGLFERHADKIGAHFEDTLAHVAKDAQPGNPLINWFGPCFHKAFRQWDVTGNSDDDVAIWKLLGGGFTRNDANFWEVLALPPGAVGE